MSATPQAIPTAEELRERHAQWLAQRLRFWAKRAAISTTMQRELECAADWISMHCEGETAKGEQHGVLQPGR